MGKDLNLEFNIGDVVYTANSDEAERRIINAVKVTGLSHKTEYGFKSNRDNFMWPIWSYTDGYSWYSPVDIFTDEASAMKRVADLKAKAEAEKEREKLKEIADMEERIERDKENLRRKKKGLPELDDDGGEDY